MNEFGLASEKPGLLVSVRNAAEARSALAGGADVIDVKEPSRGALGAADSETVAQIVQAVGGRTPVSVALGELVDLIDSVSSSGAAELVDGVSLFKVGLAHCAKLGDWKSRWREFLANAAASGKNRRVRPVAVAYADWQSAGAPSPHDVLGAAIEHRCPALLVDTWGKAGGTLFDHWPVDEVREFSEEVKSHGITIVLAGSLTGANIAKAARLAPSLVAVRTAACDGGREGTVSEKRVRELKIAISESTNRAATR